MDNVSLLQDTRNNKNLLRVAMEMAGKPCPYLGEIGELATDQWEAVPPPSRKPPVVEEDLCLNEDSREMASLDEELEQFANLVLETLVKLEENLDFELVDEDLDFAIESVINSLIED